MKKLTILKAFCIGFAAILAMGCATNKQFDDRGNIYRFAYEEDEKASPEQKLTALDKWKDEQRELIYIDFDTEYRDSLDSFISYLLKDQKNIEQSKLEMFLNQFISAQEKFTSSLDELNKVVKERLSKFAGKKAVEDFLPLAVPTVVINGIPYNALAVARLQKKMEETSAAEMADMYKELSGILYGQYNKRLANAPAFAKWYWSFKNTVFVRPAATIFTGSWEETAKEHYFNIINTGVDLDRHIRITASYKEKSDLIFNGILYAFILCENPKTEEVAIAVQESMSIEDFFKPYSLTAYVASVGAVFGLDTTMWKDNFSLLEAGIDLGLRVFFDGIPIVAALIAGRPEIAAVILIASILGEVVFYHLKTPKKQKAMKEEIQKALITERTLLLEAISRTRFNIATANIL